MQEHSVVEFGPGKTVGFSKMKIKTSLENVLSRIHALEDQIDSSKPDFDLIKNLCFELIARLPLPIQLLQNTFILRARENKSGEVFRTINEISYNPHATAGRFNLDHDPVFYGALPITSHHASGQLTTICESSKELFDSTSQQERKYFTVGKWTIIKPIPTVVLTFFNDAEKVSWHLGNLNPAYEAFFSSVCDQEDTRKCHEFYSFFSGYAAKKYDEQEKYLLTTAFFHAVQMYYGSEIGILYSSSMTENKGLNVVFSKDVVDNSYLHFDGALMFRALRDRNQYNQYSIIPCSDYAFSECDGTFRFKYIL